MTRSNRSHEGERPSLLRTGAAALAGAVAFGVGFYAGLFVVLSVWGLDAEHASFAIVTVMVGSVLAGSAVAIVMPGTTGSIVAFGTAVLLGGVLAAGLVVTDADLEALAIGGIVLSAIAAVAGYVADADTPEAF